MNKQLDRILSNSKNIAIIGHINPDGDCFGSMCGMHDYIVTKFNCLVHCFAECDTVAEEFRPFTKDIIFNPEPLISYDACICVDTACFARLGRYMDVFNHSTNTICIDHHATNDGFAQLNIIIPLSSNCENVYNILKSAKFNMTKSTAGKIFAGIVTDTNNLSTDTVTRDTHLAVIDLLDKGINAHKIIKFFLNSNSMPQYRLLSDAMSTAKFYHNDTIMVMKITKEQMLAHNAVQEDLNPIINQAFCMKHANCALLITPRNNQIHVSFRSRDNIDVSVVAQHFGGGGHKAAAAVTTPSFTKKDLEFAINNLIEQINNLPPKNNNIFN